MNHTKKRILLRVLTEQDSLFKKNGGYLLSHLRSTIGVDGLNFSVRNGKRWNPDAIATWMTLNDHKEQAK